MYVKMIPERRRNKNHFLLPWRERELILCGCGQAIRKKNVLNFDLQQTETGCLGSHNLLETFKEDLWFGSVVLSFTIISFLLLLF